MNYKEILSSMESHINSLDDEGKINTLNQIKLFLHHLSPFEYEPVDCVIWVKREQVTANDYNPNTMSPTEKKLLETSLINDGYTQPVVVLPASQNKLRQTRWQIIDGYHRYLLSKKQTLKKRLHGYIPVTVLSAENHGTAEQMAATVRHNRARGQHRVAAMSDIVRDLSRLGWGDEKIGEELGMSQDEVLRLKQISGLAELFAEHNFSEAWTVK
ncbi:ParB-like nuclease domain-containing protein [Salmonella enterica]|nr:hypothetical protein [Salmonella enterica]EAW1322183.1 hypothetical protein [Salmonella enterica subsp. diarizonae]EFO9811934.1 ParB-like nuclease domain-containing protein [Salmonella enterica subsp. enterica serovar Enteritidis]EIE2749664.1 ParB-like nuclease domain-containing protein [Salmonella enterica subsp. diarizonae serovar 48:i:z]ECC3884266.1 hypothetical protein [Salmonella enterica subsp. diarizonae]